LSVAEPGVHPLAVGHGAWRCEIAFLVHFGQTAFGGDPVLPQPLAVGGLKCGYGKLDPVIDARRARAA